MLYMYLFSLQKALYLSSLYINNGFILYICLSRLSPSHYTPHMNGPCPWLPCPINGTCAPSGPVCPYRPSMMQFKASVTVPDSNGPEWYAPYIYSTSQIHPKLQATFILYIYIIYIIIVVNHWVGGFYCWVFFHHSLHYLFTRSLPASSVYFSRHW